MEPTPPVSVLNVNDDEVARYTITRMLRRGGFEVREAADGAEALARAAEQPDVIVLDVKLPDINGFEVCRRIKAAPATAAIPVLLTSAAFVKAESRVQGLEGGADAYLVQPSEAIELLATVRALVRARRAEAERAELLRREQQAREQAEYANRLKDEFLATVSHELRTPLNAILGWTRMLRGGHVPPERRAHVLETIERNARAQAQLVEDLLDVSRILSGKLRMEFRPVSLTVVVEAAADAVRPTAEARGVSLELDAGDPGPVVGDPDRLQQVVWNLLSNAVKFTPRGGRVVTRLAREGDVALVEVVDTGDGIRASFLPFIFDRFRQADSTVGRTHGGLGLGLAIVRHLVELHGGAVAADSEGPGLGSRFQVKLPLQRDVAGVSGETPSRPDPEERLSLPEVPLLTGLHVLVVDDEFDTRELLAEVLSQQGARVTLAASAREAAEAVAARPDVLISDIGMPGGDGYELIRRLRAADDRTPAVAVTAYARGEDARKALAAGFQRHAAKPIEPGALVAIVADLCGRRRATES